MGDHDLTFDLPLSGFQRFGYEFVDSSKPGQRIAEVHEAVVQTSPLLDVTHPVDVDGTSRRSSDST